MLVPVLNDLHPNFEQPRATSLSRTAMPPCPRYPTHRLRNAGHGCSSSCVALALARQSKNHTSSRGSSSPSSCSSSSSSWTASIGGSSMMVVSSVATPANTSNRPACGDARHPTCHLNAQCLISAASVPIVQEVISVSNSRYMQFARHVPTTQSASDHCRRKAVPCPSFSPDHPTGGVISPLSLTLPPFEDG
jgi:hypothetical protein